MTVHPGAWALAVLLGGSATALPAQSRFFARPMAQAIVSATSMDPTPYGGRLTEVRVVQPVLMGQAGLANGRLLGTLTLNLESLTIPDGELTLGAWGEGYVDRRHPHTTVHELLLEAPDLFGTRERGGRIGLVAGKGFVPFGTDDPMSRPFLRYPVNHHLSQILERAVLITQLERGPVLLEGALFNGDEPERASQWPLLRLPDGTARFGDSRALRLTVRPVSDLELQASIAAVKSPEHRLAAGGNVDKWSTSARWHDQPEWGERYLLAEWARTDELDGYFRFETILVEGALRRERWSASYRIESTDRPEEDRLQDPFRSLRPHHENSILGTGCWTLHTVRITHDLADPAGPLSVIPFAEVTMGSVRKTGGGIFDPTALYGRTSLNQVSIGVQMGWGMRHHRMGRYGTSHSRPEHSHVAH